MQKVTPRTWVVIVVILMAVAVAILSFNVAASGTVVVSGSTSTGENVPGWMFNRALSNPAPYAFSFEVPILSLGSLKVGPLADTNQFIAEFFTGQLPTSEFKTLKYSYILGAGRTSTDNQFVTVSVYTNIDASTNDFDCRFDYVATNASSVNFVPQSVDAGLPGLPTVKNGTRLTGDCPDLIERMPAGSYVRAIKLTVGSNDSTADAGLTAYFDNVEMTFGIDPSGVTVYNFEPAPRTRDDCAGKKWQQYKFSNQGQCQKFVDKGIDTR